jgi:hypothetical protein
MDNRRTRKKKRKVLKRMDQYSSIHVKLEGDWRRNQDEHDGLSHGDTHRSDSLTLATVGIQATLMGIHRN